jgi:enoyl-CoA hydratase
MLCKNIIVRNENNVSIINLNRPKSLNALNAETVAELDKVFDELAADKNTGAVVITGEKNFAAGADITNMAELSPEEARAFSFSKTFNKIANCPKPVIAAIEGFALGGGMELALCCDIRIAAPDAKMGFPEINLGIFPGAGGTQRLPRLVGLSKAKQLIFTGATLKGEAALEMRLGRCFGGEPLGEGSEAGRGACGQGVCRAEAGKGVHQRRRRYGPRYGFRV